LLMKSDDPSKSLRPFRPTRLGDLVRLGRPFDGGYIVNERAVQQSDYLLSFGINDDWSFEEGFRKRRPEAEILCFDHSVSQPILREQLLQNINSVLSARFVLGALSGNLQGVRNKFRALKRSRHVETDFAQFVSRRNVSFYSRGVSNASSAKFFTIDEIFHLIPRPDLREHCVFIKMDIEQYEFRVLPELPKYFRFLTGLVVEFHDLDILWTNFVDLMNQLSASFVVAHLHANNFCELIPNSKTPKLLEVTLLHRDLIKADEQELHAAVYPIPGLDQPNDFEKEDYVLEL